MRWLAILAGTVVLGGASAEAASAATIKLNLSVQGAGSISAPVSKGVVTTCSQADPVSDGRVLGCPTPFTKLGLNDGPVTMTITAAPAPGWTFAGWTICPSGNASQVCTITALSGNLTGSLKARFEDHTAPAAVPGLTVVATGVDRPSHAVNWDAGEPGLRWQCSVDGGPLENCRSGMGLALPEGEHRVAVGAIDPSGNAGPLGSTFFTVVETQLLSGPAEGATVSSVRLAATSGVARDFECSWDRGAFSACGRGANADLKVPSLGDGSHNVRVRGRAGNWPDPTPVSRTFTLDRTAPETTLRKVDDRMDFGADEPATFRCSLDGAAAFACASPYFLPGLAAGPHTFEVYALDRVGHRDLTPARVDWTIPVATPIATPIPTPTPVPATTPAPADPSPATLPAAVKRDAAFKVTYKYRKGVLKQLKVVGIPAGQKLVVKVACPKRKACPKSPTTVRKLVGKRLAHGTKLTFTAGRAKQTIRL